MNFFLASAALGLLAAPAAMAFVDPPECVIETAFAYPNDQDQCFQEFGFQRWGWYLPNPDPNGQTYPVYAGAAMCDLDKGTVVGTAEISILNGFCSGSFTAASGYELNTFHFFCGNAAPLGTVAPGTFSNMPGGCLVETEGGTSKSCSVPLADGPVVAIVHIESFVPSAPGCGDATTPPPPPTGPGGDGDPHILTWSGKWFDYMGECDLAMLKAPTFDGHHDMNIDIRTTIQHDYSFIEAVALQIGQDVLEVGSYGDYAVNGVDTPYMGGKAGRIGGYPVHHTQVSKKKHTYDVILSPTENITLASYKQLVSIHINVDEHKEKYFANSEGILGNVNGDLKSRKGDLMEEGDVFAEDWQVTDEEPMLFRVARAPQYPAKCNMPKPKAETSRRLGETIAEEAAKKACAHKTGVFFDNCVYDVMAVGDLELAQAGAY